MKTSAITLLFGLGALAQAQGPRHGPGPGGMHIMGFDLARPGVTVTGAPVTGKQVTTETKTLADGTHITHTNTAQFYRDGQGRTRIERTFSGVGPAAASEAGKTHVEIIDPVAGFIYHLNSSNSTATKSPLPTPPSAADIAQRQAQRQARQESEGAVTTSLGTQTIQGVACTGTQTVTTIPAGKIGNDRAITITTERWYSPDLQLTLQSKRSDPFAGEVDSQFQSLSRAEPDASLFQPPASYTVTAAPAHSHIAGFHGAPPAPAQ